MPRNILLDAASVSPSDVSPKNVSRCEITLQRYRVSNVRFSNRPFGVKRFQTIHHYSVDVAHGLVLLFGIGTRGPSIMGFEHEVEQSFGRPCRQTVTIR